MALHTRILLGLAFGAGVGMLVNAMVGGDDPTVRAVVRHVTEPIGKLFLNLLLMTVVPLVFSSLVLGVAAVGDVRKLGRIGFKSFVYTIVISAVSVFIGLFLANTLRPGDIPAETRERLVAQNAESATKKVAEVRAAKSSDSPLMQAVNAIVPTNPLAAAAAPTPNLLQVMFFALLIGIAATLVPHGPGAAFLSALQGLYEITAVLIGVIMKLAPYAVACLLFSTTVVLGFELLRALALFVFTVLLGLGLHMFGTYTLALRFVAGVSPMEFFRRVKTVILTAFSTSSSNATLPTSLKVGEEELGIPKPINSFVLTVGATANQNGTAFYEGVTVLFIAQLAGVELSLAEQLSLVLLAIIGGIGTAGVPSGSIPFIIAILAGLQETHPQLNPALIAVILGADRILDMCRTVLNVVGDLTIAAYVARSEGYAIMGPRPAAPATAAPPGDERGG